MPDFAEFHEVNVYLTALELNLVLPSERVASQYPAGQAPVDGGSRRQVSRKRKGLFMAFVSRWRVRLFTFTRNLFGVFINKLFYNPN